MTNAKSLDDEYFIRNAIACWLHHFPDHKWAPIYQEMQQRERIIPKARSRPARRRKSSQSPAT